MKNRITNIILVVIILPLLTSCRKYEFGKDTHFYTGHIYNISDSTPYANTSFILYDKRQSSPIAGKGDHQFIDIQTDENGYFEVTFRQIRGSILCLSKPQNKHSCTVEYIPQKKESDTHFSLGNIYTR